MYAFRYFAEVSERSCSFLLTSKDDVSDIECYSREVQSLPLHLFRPQPFPICTYELLNFPPNSCICFNTQWISVKVIRNARTKSCKLNFLDAAKVSSTNGCRSIDVPLGSRSKDLHDNREMDCYWGS
jgi:hypothetical protein